MLQMGYQSFITMQSEYEEGYGRVKWKLSEGVERKNGKWKMENGKPVSIQIRAINGGQEKRKIPSFLQGI